MIIIREKAEQNLIQEVQLYQKNNKSQRCLYLNFGNIKEDEKNYLAIFEEKIEQFFNDKACQIFICHDNDIFIFAPDITNKDKTKILEYISKLMPASFGTPKLLEGLAHIFENKINFKDIEIICEQKLANFENKKKDKQEQVAIKYSQKLENIKIRNELVSTLAQRRESRDFARILVIEDDIFTQKLIKNTLGKKHDISIASNGCEGVMNYAGIAPDILFLDIGLPDITGYDVLQKIFKIDPNAYIVMLSGNGDKENILKAIELGASGFIGKPFTKNKIFQYIEKSPHLQKKSYQELAQHDKV